jgi:hypothetical protein
MIRIDEDVDVDRIAALEESLVPMAEDEPPVGTIMRWLLQNRHRRGVIQEVRACERHGRYSFLFYWDRRWLDLMATLPPPMTFSQRAWIHTLIHTIFKGTLAPLVSIPREPGCRPLRAITFKDVWRYHVLWRLGSPLKLYRFRYGRAPLFNEPLVHYLKGGPHPWGHYYLHDEEFQKKIAIMLRDHSPSWIDTDTMLDFIMQGGFRWRIGETLGSLITVCLFFEDQ